MSRKKKIVLTNSYAVNNGDLALVLALYDQLIKRGYEVRLATFHFGFLSKQYPHLPFIKELLDYSMPGGTFVKRIFSKINFLFNRKYNQHDVFIASPGGYVNSYYGIKRSLLPLVHAKKRSKKTAIYSQSIGPLNDRDKKLLTRYSAFIDVILVRDNYSRDCLSAIQCSSKVFQTKDAAFLLPPRGSNASPDCNTVAISVREWKHDNRDMGNFNTMIKSFCVTLLERGLNIEFISTCQGVKDYRDDSIVAEQIKEEIVLSNPEFSNQLKVNSRYNSYYELVEMLNTKYLFTIGTRLHMCILSLINGTPALNISYEVKGIECYRYLGLEDFSVDFNESQELAMKKFNDFLHQYGNLKKNLPGLLHPVHEESKSSLNLFIKEMEL